ncbi:MAG: single-stranded DNA-binding protein [Flavobacteriaceae bacterium]|nr:single-stranded DNA-binding protein [Flavobacteriaceae bacterium]
MSVNKVILLGHVGDEVKMHYFDGGGSIGRLPLATNESYTNKQTGEKVTDTQWHNIVVKNKAAEIFEKYVKKGDQIYVEGSIKTRKWQSEDGTDRYSTEIHVKEFSFVGGSKQESKSDGKTHQAQPVEEDDSLPF